MQNYIESFLSILPESQRERLQALLNVDTWPPGTEEELEERIKELLEDLGKGQMTMQLRLQEELTNSDLYNQTLKEIIADLNTLYAESNRMDALLTNHKQLNKVIISNLTKDLKRLESRIEALNLIADNTEGYGTASRENFSDLHLVETDRGKYGSLFTDKDGSPLEENYNAVIDTQEGVLKLGSSSSYDRVHTISGTTVAKIEILEQAGEGFSDKDPNYGIDKALDNRLDTFWGEVILSDGVLKVPMAGLDSGAICTFKITFPSPCTVSQFSINPYCEFPLEIVSIGYTTDDSNAIAGWAIKYDPEKPILIDQPTTLDFPCILAKALIVTIRQSHAYKNHYTISIDQKNNRELWSKIAAAERKLTLETPWVDKDPNTINPTLDQDMIDKFDVRWQEYLEAQREYERKHQDAILFGLIAFGAGLILGPQLLGLSGAELFAASAGLGYATYELFNPDGTPKEPYRVQVEKYEYVYGAYDIQVRGNEYLPVGIYVSKPHSVNGNVQRVVLEAEEWHPVIRSVSGEIITKKAYDSNGALINLDEPLRRTSVEYYVSCGDEPNTPWFPILPLDQDYVNNELLKFTSSSSTQGKLRFYADSNKEIRVYRNEEPLDPRYWSFGEDPETGEPNTMFIRISPAVWDSSSFFTVDYYPDESKRSAHEIDFLLHGATTRRMVEYFNGPGTNTVDKNCSVKLTYYPFVDRGKLIQDRANYTYTYNPVEVTLNPAEYKYKDPSIHKIQGKDRTITSEILSTRNPSTDLVTKPPARLLNVTDYFSKDIPALNFYNPRDVIPTFEYYHEGKRVYFTETFRHDGPIENYGISHGNAIVKVSYDYLVSGVRCKIILRSTCSTDASVTPKVNWYTLKFKVLN